MNEVFGMLYAFFSVLFAAYVLRKPTKFNKKAAVVSLCASLTSFVVVFLGCFRFSPETAFFLTQFLITAVLVLVSVFAYYFRGEKEETTDEI